MLRTSFALKMYNPERAPEKYLTTGGPKSPQDSGTGGLGGARCSVAWKEEAASNQHAARRQAGLVRESCKKAPWCCSVAACFHYNQTQ
jgi:hypothetical protein